MKLNLKALGLALAAMLAMGAVAASSASAEFTAPAGATITGNDDNLPGVFEVTGVEVECDDIAYDGDIIEEGTSVTVNPAFTECSGGGLEIDVTGFTHNDPEESKCHFVLDTDGTAGLECAPGGEVTVESTPGVCVVHIPPQKNLGEITYTEHEREGFHALTLDINITGITATHTDGFLCPMTGSGHGTEGTLTGEATVWAEDENNNTVDLTHDSNTQPAKPTP